MALHADTSDGHACILHFLDHVIDAVALLRICSVVVVVDEDGIRIGFMGKLKCFCYELIAAEFVKLALAVRVGLSTSLRAASV